MGVEMKVPSELLGRRLSSILAVGGSLRFAQEVDRHRCPEKGIVFGERDRDRSHLPTTVSLNPWPITPIFECPPTRRTSRTRSSQCSTIATLKALLRSSSWRTPPAVGGLGETGRSGDCSRRPMRVPLAPRCAEIPEELWQRSNDRSYVFLGRKAGQSLSYMAFRTTLRRMKRTDCTAHGFRSSFRVWSAGRTHYPQEVCEAALAHVLKDRVEAVYRRTDLPSIGAS